MTDFNEEVKCVYCGSLENLQWFTNPFNPHENIVMCQNCSAIPFGEHKNKAYQIPWNERK